METSGLTRGEAERLLERVGPNVVPQGGRLSVASSIGLQLRDPLVLVLLAACVLTLLTGDATDAAVIAFVVVVNTAVGVTQAVRADRAITALAELSAPVVRVRREGVESTVA
ncbi:MAG: cation-transporting P-type ATPase, partial [Nocardioides sp.]